MSAFATNPSPAWAAVGWTMLHLVWIGALLGLFAAVARFALRKARPEVRYWLAIALLSLMTIAPAATFALLYRPESQSKTPLVEGAGRTVLDSIPPREPNPPRLPMPVAIAEEPTPRTIASRLESLIPYLPWIWLAGSLSTMVLVGTGLVGVEDLRRSSRILEEGEVTRRCRALAGSLGIARRVAVGVCDRLVSPVLVGVVRPMILLPLAAVGGWSMEQVEMVLLHELAHVRRWDNLVNLLQCAAEAILFFHPAAWWISAWIRWERELCCDRLVVDRVGAPRAYAEILLGLAGLQGESRIAAMAMAQGQVMTRIRRILDREDHSMKLTMPEGLGVMGTVVVVATMALAIGSHAEGPAEARDARRALLKRAVESVEALKGPAQGELVKAEAMDSIARAQIKVGDRAAALATLKKSLTALEAGTFKTFAGDAQRLDNMARVATRQLEAGDPAAARITLDRLTTLLDGLKVGPPKEVKLVPHKGGNPGVMTLSEESDGMIQAELYGSLIETRIKLKDFEEARRLIHHVLGIMTVEPDSIRGLLLGYLGMMMNKAGDRAAARGLTDQACKIVDAIEKPDERTATQCHLAKFLAQSGDLDRAMKLALSLGQSRRLDAVQNVIESVTEIAADAMSFDPSGLNIKIGADSYTIADRDEARRNLPRIAEMLIGRSSDVLLKVRMLSKVAHLQAKAGDFAGAWRTVGAIPGVKRKDFPGPSDGYYDAIVPATMALIAGEEAGAGDKSAATGKLQAALDASRAIEDAGEKIVAMLVIAREQDRAGAKAPALATLAEIKPLVLSRAEPFRSKSLTMIVAQEIGAGDLAAATRSAGLIRAFPKSEKLVALKRLADGYEKAGDVAAAKGFIRQALEVAEAKAQTDGVVRTSHIPATIGINTFIPNDAEFGSTFTGSQAILLRGWLNGTEDALRAIEGLPADAKMMFANQMTGRNSAYTSLVATLIHRGDLAGAEAVLAKIQSPESRLLVLLQMAHALGQ